MKFFSFLFEAILETSETNFSFVEILSSTLNTKFAVFINVFGSTINSLSIKPICTFDFTSYIGVLEYAKNMAPIVISVVKIKIKTFFSSSVLNNSLKSISSSI